MANQRTDSKGKGTIKVTLIKSPIGFERNQLQVVAHFSRWLEAKRVVGSTLTVPSAAIIPDRKVSDEMWPSPTARRLRMKRNPPGGAPD